LVAQANDISAKQGISPEQALYNYAKSQGIDDAGVDVMMGFPPGTTAKWAAVSGKPLQGSGTTWNVDPGTMTVQERIKSIIGENGGLIQQARSGAMQQMNARGLINSSMAQGAADDAVYRAAMPIAQADAAMYGKAASENAGNATSIANTNTGASTSLSTNAANNATTLATNAANNATTLATNAANNTTTLATNAANNAQSAANLKAQTDAAAALGLTEASYKQLTQSSASASSLMTNYQSNLTSLLRDPVYTTAEARQAAVDQLTNSTMAAVQMIGAASGDVNLAAFMASLFPEDAVEP
jgi:hypothetical protein